jgi:hypothetical protein
MVPSSVLTISVDGECLTCSGFSFIKTVHLGSFQFIADYFDGLSLSSRRNDLGTTFMGSTRSGPPSSWLSMIEDTTKEFHAISSGEVGSGIPSPRWHDAGALPAPITTTLWLEVTSATKSMMMVPM